MIRNIIFFLILGGVFLSCKDKSTPLVKTEEADKVTNSENLQPLPDSVRKVLLDQCTAIDYIFKTGGMSISFDRQSGLAQNLEFISKDFPLQMRSYGCASIARKTFVIQMDLYLEAELFLDDKCKYYLFYKNGKPVYLAGISQEGLNFYSGIFNSVPKLPQNQKQ